ncbi:nucleoid protein H-NS [Dyella jiangningensis]|uniref:H-NS histone family protein n=1 Tax=Dyella sp. AtDHG13 TaxID=1938897 RepID=UPI000891AE1D|nr:H-NS histone family protein [Dyella sp. AtDHG13]PXV55990.1 DNA-binding protein H-NS [Dyella sp. AtDHG13]SDK47586.1 nucleoid protein H-NS [Dyella jiangningensis]
MAIKLDSLSPAELQALIRNAEAQMESARKHQVQEVRTKIDALLKDAGLSIDEVYPRRGGRGAKSPKVVVAPKYRNPSDAAQTWSGRGKRPQWFSAALKKKGVTVESMLIGGNAMKAPPIKAARKAPGKASATRAAKK